MTDVSGLKTRMTSVEQTAEGISMTVGEKMLAGNMLAGTMFRREEEVTWNNPADKGVISTAVQLGGVNSVYLESTSTTAIFKGVIWRKIPVTAGKKYNMSFWYRTPDAASNGEMWMEMRGYKADGSATSPSQIVYARITSFVANTWVKSESTFTALQDLATVDVLIYLVTKGKMYIARPMLIAGSYVGWQRSEQDYDYIGGNLLDETKTLVQRESLTHVEGTVTGNAFGWCSAIYAQGASPYTEMLQWWLPYDLNADYTLSFMAKGTGKIQTHIYSDAGAADVALFTEAECETYDVGVWGSANYTLTPDWKRRTVRWRTKGTRTQANALVVIRVDPSSEAYIAQPKLEKGCTATAWTDGDGDMVSTKALLATGVDIENRKVTITSDNVEVRNNSGETTALLDETGKIQTNLVVASVIRTGDIGRPHMEAKGSTFELYGYEQYPFIQIAWREDVGSVLRFVDEKTGQLLYDLGPTKFLDNFTEIQDKYEEFYMRPLANDSTIWTILSSTQDAAYRYYRYTEGYKMINGSTRQYHVTGTTTPSNYNTMYLKTASYTGTPIADGWYVEAKNRMYSAWTNSAGLTLYKATLINFVGGKVNLFVDCYFTEAMKEYQVAVKTVGCNTNGIALNQATYPYLWSYGVGLPSRE